ncbi:MAG: GtrA family protein, partial [Patescibacteria group bacterium]
MQTILTYIKTILFQHKYLHFFLTGTSGVAINLLVTWIFTTFVFGLAEYFKAYLIGLTINLLYNFALHTLVTFKTTSGHFPRLIGFVIYSIGITLLQAVIVKSIVEFIGLKYYLLVIATTILALSMITFVLF